MPIIGATEIQPVNILGSYMSGLEMGRANQLAQLQMQAAQQKMAEQQRQLDMQNRLRERISTPGYLDRPEALTELTAEFGAPGAQVVESVAKAREATSKARKSEQDRELEGVKALSQALATAKDARSWQILRQRAEDAGLDLKNVPQEYDPLYVDTVRDNTLGYEKLLENQRQLRTLKVQEGQLAQSRARLEFDKNVETWKRENPDLEIKDTGMGLMAVNKKTGAVKPVIYNGEVLSGPASKDARVDEQNTAFNAKRLLNSTQRIIAAIQRSPGAMSAGALEASSRGLPLFGEGISALLRSEDRQIVENNYEGVVDALLFLSTGAAYNKEQRQATINEVKPLFTDKPKTLEDKKGKLIEYIEAAKIKSGRAWTPELDQAMNVIVDMYGSPEAGAETSAGDSVPAGIDPEIWKVMTPTEKALWRK